MARVVSVAVSQTLGRSSLNSGSWAEIARRNEPRCEETGTLETGCEIDVYFAGGTTAEVGLNNYVYTLEKL